MKFTAILFSILMVSTVAKADYLICNNGQEKSTEIEFYHHDAQVTFQLSAPYKDEYLYLIGLCYSENEIGLPYNCEVDSNVVSLNLIAGEKGVPTAEFTTRLDDGTSAIELIPCTHFE
jgi:hypothetical protein